MKKLIIITIFFSIIFIPLLKAQNFKDTRVIYLLDVTLSMWGEAPGAKNIFNDVRDNLIDAIKAIENPKTDIIIVTFQDQILQRWEGKATNSGKNKLITKLKNIDPSKLKATYTNIYAPLHNIRQLISPQKVNVIYILTDGAHNMQSPPKQTLYNEVKNWGAYALNRDYYAFLVELVSNANDNNLRRIIQQTNNIDIIKGIEFYVFAIEEPNPVININDDLSFSLSFKGDQISNIPKNFSFTINSSNQYFNLPSKSYILKDQPFNIELIPINSLGTLRNTLPVPESTMILTVDYDTNKYPNIKLLDNRINLKVKNIREKVLKMQVIE